MQAKVSQPVPFLFRLHIPFLQTHLSQRLPCKSWQHETRFVDLFIVVAAQLLLLFRTPATQWRLHVSVGILAADHETDLAGWVGWDGSVGVFDGWEDFFAGFLELRYHLQVKPLVLG